MRLLPSKEAKRLVEMLNIQTPPEWTWEERPSEELERDNESYIDAYYNGKYETTF